MPGDLEQAVFIRLPDIIQPFERHAIAQQFLISNVVQRCWSGLFDLHIFWNNDFLHPLPNLHQLRRAGLWVCFQLTPRRPAIGLVVVPYIAQQQAIVSSVHNQAKIPAHPHRAEIGISRPIQLMEFHPRLRRIELQIERRGLDGLLLFVGQPRQAGGEGVGDAEVHGLTLFLIGYLINIFFVQTVVDCNSLKMLERCFSMNNKNI
ncbi:MAG: hypothetical protein ACE5IY_15855 [bacterium]